MSTSDGEVRLETAQRFLSLFNHDVAGAAAELSDDVIYRVPGQNALAGEFRGRQSVIEHMQTLIERTHGTFDTIKIDDWMTGDSHVAALIHSHIQSGHRLYDGHHLHLFSFDKSNKICEIRIFFNNQHRVDEFLGV